MNIRKIGVLSLSAALLGVSVYFGAVEWRQTVDNKTAIEVVSRVQGAARSKTEEERGEPNLDWTELKKVNKAISGWISIPGTKIDFPVMKSNDNDFYLTHDSEDNYSVYGSIFMDYRQNEDLSSMNTYIYGHNVDPSIDSSFFGELRNYYSQEFFDSHKRVLYYTENQVYEGEIFAVHADSAKSDAYKVEYLNEDDLKSHASFMLNNSEVSNKFDVDNVSSMITLWACAEREITDSNGEWTSADKSRTFVSVSLKPIK